MLRIHGKSISESISKIRLVGNLKAEKASRLFGLSRNWYYRNRENKTCSKSFIRKCFKQYPNQLTHSEIGKIEQVISKPVNYRKTLTTLYYQNIKNGNFSFGYSTFAKYVKALGYRNFKQKNEKNRPNGLKAIRAFEWLHVDVTFVQTKYDGMQKVAFVKDNYSKAILHYGSTSSSSNSLFISNLFKETFSKFNLYNFSKEINILSDGGPENKGLLLKWVNDIKAPPFVTKITASSPECPFSNSMSERTHSIYKTEFMNKKFSTTQKQHLKDLDFFVHDYNHNRFPCDHLGLTPYEVLEGKVPVRGMFKDQINNGKELRLKENQRSDECCGLV